MLVEDLPNILHPAVRSRFHDTLRAHVERACDVSPLVLVISDAGVPAEGSSNGGRGRDLVIDVRTIVPPELSSTSLFTDIRFVHLHDFAFFLIGPTDARQIQSHCSYATRFRGKARNCISQSAPLTRYIAFDPGRCWRGCAQRDHDVGIYLCASQVSEAVK